MFVVYGEELQFSHFKKKTRKTSHCSCENPGCDCEDDKVDQNMAGVDLFVW